MQSQAGAVDEEHIFNSNVREDAQAQQGGSHLWLNTTGAWKTVLAWGAHLFYSHPKV